MPLELIGSTNNVLDMAIARSEPDKWHSTAPQAGRASGIMGKGNMVVLAAAAVCVMLVLTLTMTSLAQAQSTTPRLSSSAQGQLIAAVDGVWVHQDRVQPGASVGAGSSIKTDASGRARFTFLHATSLQIAGNTELQVERLLSSGTDRRVRAVVLNITRGVGRLVVDGQSGEADTDEVAVIRSADGGVVVLESGTLDVVASGNRLVAVMRSGRANCRGADAQMLSLDDSAQSPVCVLSGGGVRPSLLSVAMDRVIDERLSFPPSSIAHRQTDAGKALVDYAVNDLSASGEDKQQRLQRQSDPDNREGLTPFIVRQLLQSGTR